MEKSVNDPLPETDPLIDWSRFKKPQEAKGPFTNDVSEGGQPYSDIRILDDFGIDKRARGSNPKNLADVICEWPQTLWASRNLVFIKSQPFYREIAKALAVKQSLFLHGTGYYHRLLSTGDRSHSTFVRSPLASFRGSLGYRRGSTLVRSPLASLGVALGTGKALHLWDHHLPHWGQ